MRVLHVVLLLLLNCATGAHVAELRAQSAQPEAGTRVRVSAPGVLPRRVAGRVVRITPDTVVLQTRAVAPVAVPLAAAERMERSLGRSHLGGAARGLAFGALAGGTAMGAAVLGGAEFCIYVSCLNNNLAGAAGGFLIGAGIGAPVGAVIGGVLGIEEWGAITPGPRLRALHVSPAGIVVSIAIP